MPAAGSIVPGLCLALMLSLGACGGGGEEGGGDVPSSGTSPPTATPSSPSPPPPSSHAPPAASNQSPDADAGEDQTTVEEQDVTVDGSRTRDPDGDALSYAWRIVSAPAGSGVVVDADTARFVFRPDLPGRYELQLTASDGRSDDTDTMRVTAEPLLVFSDDGRLEVDKKGKEEDRRLDLALRTSALYRGGSVGFSVGTDAPWLSAVHPTGTSAPAGDTTRVPVQLVMQEVERLPNGEHEARVIVTPSGGWEQAITTVTLELKLNGRHKAVPYVAYTGEPSRVTLDGKGLLEIAGKPIVIDGVSVLNVEVTSDRRATIELPPLPAGEHWLRIAGADELSPELARIVVRDEPVHLATELALPGLVRSLEYDAERDAFYAVFVATDGTRMALRLQNSGAGEWTSELIPVAAPRAVALTADGSELLVSADGCTLHRLDPPTLTVTHSLTRARCDPAGERLDAIAVLADGRALLVDDARESVAWSYPLDAPSESMQVGSGAPVAEDLRQGSRIFVAPSGKVVFTFGAAGSVPPRYQLNVRQLR